MQPRLDQVVDRQLEHRYREKAYAGLGGILRNGRVVSLKEIEEELSSSTMSQSDM